MFEREQQAVEAVEQAAVAGEKSPRIFHPETALEHRFDQAADLTERADAEPE